MTADHVEATVRPGEVRLRGVSRKFRILSEQNATLKEVLLRRRRTVGRDLWALRDVDLDVEPGEAIGIVGENGAGKSTLLKLVAGILYPQAGTIEVGGSVASMLELGAGFHPDFTGRENVYMNGSIHGLSEREIDQRFDDIVAFSELGEFVDMPVKTYSSGMHMRLAFAVSSHLSPDILLLDEVLAVGDEAFQRKCMGRIFEFRRRGGTLLFVSHDAGAIERVCDRALLVGGGEIVADGPPNEVLQHYHRKLAGQRVEQADAGMSADDEGEWGTREISISRVVIANEHGEPVRRFLSGDPIVLEVYLECQETVANPTVGMSIHDVDGKLCYGSNTRLSGLVIPEISAPTVVRFRCERLPLHEGRFDVSASVHAFDESVMYHWIERKYSFAVFQRSSGIGLVDISGTWTVDDANRASIGAASDPAGASRLGD